MKNLILIVVILFSIGCRSTKGQLSGVYTYNPYLFVNTDTVFKEYIDADTFSIRYVHGLSYMSTLVGRFICDIDSTVKDTINMVDASTGIETKEIMFGRKNCREDTDFYDADRHYYSKIQVFLVCDGYKTPIGNEMDGYYVPHGCYEDIPKNWVSEAKKH